MIARIVMMTLKEGVLTEVNRVHEQLKGQIQKRDGFIQLTRLYSESDRTLALVSIWRSQEDFEAFLQGSDDAAVRAQLGPFVMGQFTSTFWQVLHLESKVMAS